LDRLKVAHSNVAFYGLICGPFTLASHLLGSEIFLKMYDNPDYIKKLMENLSDIASLTANQYIQNGADIIAIVDPMVSQISKEHFDEFVFTPLNRVFDSIRRKSVDRAFFVCGDCTRILDSMINLQCGNISVDENVCLQTLKEKIATNRTKIMKPRSFGGNIKLTSALLLGSEDDCKLDAIRCLEIGNVNGYVLSPGCDIPFHTPQENVIAVKDMLFDEYARRVAKTTITASVLTEGNITLPDYRNSDSIYIDIVTLDSSSCAPCQYMVKSVMDALTDIIDKRVVVKEHKITTQEGMLFMSKLGVKQIPSICINGNVVFSSITPNKDQIISEIKPLIQQQRQHLNLPDDTCHQKE
jgi:hypothetical protein